MEHTRRVFLELMAWLAASSAEQRGAPAGRAMAPDAGELCYVGPSRDPVRIKVSKADGGSIAMIVQDMSPGTSVPMHLHEREDEIILIQSGTGVAILGERETPVTAGSVVWVPKGTWHAGRNTGTTTLKWTGIYAPAGFEGYFKEISRPPGVAPRERTAEAWEVLDRRYGIRYQR